MISTTRISPATSATWPSGDQLGSDKPQGNAGELSAAPACQRTKSMPKPAKRNVPKAVKSSSPWRANNRTHPQRYCQPKPSMRRTSAQFEETAKEETWAADNG